VRIAGRRHRSPPAAWLGHPLLAACVLVVAGAVLGKASIHHQALAVAGVGLFGLLVVGLLRPKVVLTLAILSTAWTPMHFVDGLASYPQGQKSLFWAAALFMAHSRGIDRRFVLPLLAYPLVMVLSALGGTPAPGLTTAQTLQTLASLTAGWAFLVVMWDAREDLGVLKLLACLATITVGLGAVLDLAGIWPLFDPRGSVPRLQGATIASGLGMSAVLGFAATLLLLRATSWRPALPMAAVNAVLVLASIGRGPILALVILLVPGLWRIVRASIGVGTLGSWLKALAVVGAIAASAAVVLPQIQARNDQRVYIPDKGLVEADATTGRLDAWSRAYDEAKVDIAFGRGLGAGPAIGATQEFFLAQHNEYLRMLLEGGIVGGVLLLFALVGAAVRAVRAMPARLRADAAALAVATAVIAATDNPLTSPTYSARFALALGICVALGRNASGQAGTAAREHGTQVARVVGEPVPA
jgi:hypothetical protein